MGLLDRIFGYIKIKSNIASVNPASNNSGCQNENCMKLMQFYSCIKKLLDENKYIAKSEYVHLLEQYIEVVNIFDVLDQSNMLQNFCSLNNVDNNNVNKAVYTYKNIEEVVEKHNEKFISYAMAEEKEYFDDILKSVDPAVVLDEDQRRVILTDEDYCLVIAGAGAGKTTTVAAKVKYLVERKNIEPRDILVISFTNKAVGELRDKINKSLHIDCPIATFHSTGNAILRINDPEPLNIFDGSKLYFLLQDYFKQSILTNESLVNNLIMFFASYFEAPYECR